ncbi:MAG: hypothetical protein M0R33_22390 [Methylomonas sp.]|jgi:tRNA1(Val) A37 N6-methylase TrmN6|uniref:hypothetical protein n=1 Tax=Methylomonas sp. TaxID=418 RepID=UPI0025D983BB|nr:hypothetical protein [Methylomonas sp.]MCK9609194.1 hypothetical protein [Methylomonas sp.]
MANILPTQGDEEIFGDFPLRHTYISQSEIRAKFEALRRVSPQFDILPTPYYIKAIPDLDVRFFDPVTGKSNFVILVVGANDFLDYGVIVDWFTEPQRIRARMSGEKQTPLESYLSRDDYFKRKATSAAMHDPAMRGQKFVFVLREIIYRDAAREVSTFRVNVMAAMIRRFSARRILDPCAGWGSRLLGAIAEDVDYYCGVDPNAELHPAYREMIDFFSRDSLRGHYDMICAPFETAQLPDACKDVDLVITSPPYFDYEIYSSDPQQSIIAHSGFEAWYNDFLIPLFRKSVTCAKIGGIIAIIISDPLPNPNSRGCREPFVQRMIADFNRQYNARYLGVIAYAEKSIKNRQSIYRSPQPIFIWQKKE